jgi:hypothetical protein
MANNTIESPSSRSTVRRNGWINHRTALITTPARPRHCERGLGHTSTTANPKYPGFVGNEPGCHGPQKLPIYQCPLEYCGACAG